MCGLGQLLLNTARNVVGDYFEPVSVDKHGPLGNLESIVVHSFIRVVMHRSCTPPPPSRRRRRALQDSRRPGYGVRYRLEGRSSKSFPEKGLSVISLGKADIYDFVHGGIL